MWTSTFCGSWSIAAQQQTATTPTGYHHHKYRYGTTRVPATTVTAAKGLLALEFFSLFSLNSLTGS